MKQQNKQILQLAVPSIISNITVPLLGLIDLAIVGHLGDVALIGAVAVGSMIFNMIYWIFGFLRMGTSGMTAQALGQRNLSLSMQLLVRSFLIAIGIGLLFILLQTVVLWFALWVMHPSERIAHFASVYFHICIWGAPAMLGLYAFTGWFVGMQNTRVPMIVSILQNIINIAASTLLVFGFGMTIEGVAWGTLIAQWAAFCMVAAAFFYSYRRLWYYRWRERLFEQKAMLQFFKVNRDIFLRTLFLVAVNLFFVSAGARQGDLILSVNALLITLYTIFSYVSDGFAYAGEALSGKYYGAGNHKMFQQTIHHLFQWGFALAFLFTLLYYVGGDAFLSLLTDDCAVIEASHAYFPWAVCIPLAGIAAFIYDGIFIGITETRGMLISSVVATLFFFGVYFALESFIANHALWLAMLVYLALRGIVQAVIMNQKQKTIWKSSISS